MSIPSKCHRPGSFVLAASMTILIAALAGCSASSTNATRSPSAHSAYSTFPIGVPAVHGYKTIDESTEFRLSVNAGSEQLKRGGEIASASDYRNALSVEYLHRLTEPFESVNQNSYGSDISGWGVSLYSFAKAKSSGKFDIVAPGQTGILHVATAAPSAEETYWPWVHDLEAGKKIARELAGADAHTFNATSFYTATRFVGLTQTGVVYADLDMKTGSPALMRAVAEAVAGRRDSLSQPVLKAAPKNCSVSQASDVFRVADQVVDVVDADGGMSHPNLIPKGSEVICSGDYVVGLSDPARWSVAVVFTKENPVSILEASLHDKLKPVLIDEDTTSWQGVDSSVIVAPARENRPIFDGIPYPGDRQLWVVVYAPGTVR